MELIKLTDALNDGDIKEYVDYESITNIQPLVERKRKFGFFGSIESKVTGSVVFTKNGDGPTYVKELPEQILILIENAKISKLTGER